MTKRVLMCVFVAVCLSIAGVCIATDKGPADMILKVEKDPAKKPKTAVFPHAKHQEIAECGDCHHSAADGKQVPYEEGQAVQKCEDCHYKGSGMPDKLDSYKAVAHKNCKDCHKKAAEEKPELAEKFKKCMPCHPKK